jgi:hypothetical protein
MLVYQSVRWLSVLHDCFLGSVLPVSNDPLDLVILFATNVLQRVTNWLWLENGGTNCDQVMQGGAPKIAKLVYNSNN